MEEGRVNLVSDLNDKLASSSGSSSFFDDMAEASGVDAAKGNSITEVDGRAKARLLRYQLHPIVAIRVDEAGNIYRELDGDAPDYFSMVNPDDSRRKAAEWADTVYRLYHRWGNAVMYMPIKDVSKISPRELILQVKAAVDQSRVNESKFNSKVSG